MEKRIAPGGRAYGRCGAVGGQSKKCNEGSMPSCDGFCKHSVHLAARRKSPNPRFHAAINRPPSAPMADSRAFKVPWVSLPRVRALTLPD